MNRVKFFTIILLFFVFVSNAYATTVIHINDYINYRIKTGHIFTASENFSENAIKRGFLCELSQERPIMKSYLDANLDYKTKPSIALIKVKANNKFCAKMNAGVTKNAVTLDINPADCAAVFKISLAKIKSIEVNIKNTGNNKINIYCMAAPKNFGHSPESRKDYTSFRNSTFIKNEDI